MERWVRMVRSKACGQRHAIFASRSPPRMAQRAVACTADTLRVGRGIRSQRAYGCTDACATRRACEKTNLTEGLS